jgi:hypothetical protein
VISGLKVSEFNVNVTLNLYANGHFYHPLRTLKRADNFAPDAERGLKEKAAHAFTWTAFR